MIWCLQDPFLRLLCGAGAKLVIAGVRLAQSVMPRSLTRLMLHSRLTSMGLTLVVSAEIDWLSREPLLWLLLLLLLLLRHGA